MEDPISISYLNDFIFCPMSIYFHSVDYQTDKMSYGSHEQLEGSALHETVDAHTYSDKKDILQGVSVYCEKYGLFGKIDIFDAEKGILRERKRKISAIYDGQVFQLYAYYYCLTEMGYTVNKLVIYSMTDNKTYNIPLPEDDENMKNKFEQTVRAIKDFSYETFVQDNKLKCEKCVYEPLCSYSAKENK